ncbi:hypothetical protein KR093_000392, partial [Drosophila rubida]
PTISQLLIAAAALICLCAADVSHINQKPPQDVLVPFNDLLPPPLEESTTTSTTTTTTTTTATKPTKKSYYQQQAKSKDTLHQASTTKSQPELQLALDLLPPFVEAPESNAAEQPQIKDVRATTQQPLVSSRPTATTKRSATLVAKPPRVARPNSIGSAAAASSLVPQKSSISDDLITQYLTNFQFTTRRPSRGALPTLTPFPNHIKI